MNMLKKIQGDLPEVCYVPYSVVTNAQKTFLNAIQREWHNFPAWLQKNSSQSLEELLENYPGNFTVNKLDRVIAIEHQHMSIMLMFGLFNNENKTTIKVVIDHKLHSEAPGIVILKLDDDLNIVSIDNRITQEGVAAEEEYPEFQTIYRPFTDSQEGQSGPCVIQSIADLAEAVRNYIGYELV